jgi:hypothetical protein
VLIHDLPLTDPPQVPLGTFTVMENSTRAGTVPLREGEGVLYGLQLSSIKPGAKLFDLVIYKSDDLPVLAVKSTDGEEAWLLMSIVSVCASCVCVGAGVCVYLYREGRGPMLTNTQAHPAPRPSA